MPTHTQHTDTSKKLPHMSGSTYEPKVGDTITLELPDERTRAVIERVVAPDAAIAKLNTYTTSKSHNYRKGDLVACRYEVLGMNQAGWRVMSDRELADAEARGKKKRK